MYNGLCLIMTLVSLVFRSEYSKMLTGNEKMKH